MCTAENECGLRNCPDLRIVLRLVPCPLRFSERLLCRQPTGPTPLNHRDCFRGRASRHGTLNSLLQEALYLASPCAVYSFWTIVSGGVGLVVKVDDFLLAIRTILDLTIRFRGTKMSTPERSHPRSMQTWKSEYSFERTLSPR